MLGRRREAPAFGDFLRRTAPQYRPSIEQAKYARVVGSFVEFERALHDAILGRLSEIVVVRPIPVTATIEVRGLPAPLRIRAAGEGGFYDASGHQGPLFKVFDTTNDGNTHRRSPVLIFEGCYFRSYGAAIEGSSADSVYVTGGAAKRATGGDTDFITGDFGDLVVDGVDAPFLDVDVTVNSCRVQRCDIGDVDLTASSTQALWVVSNNRAGLAGNVTLTAGSAGPHAVVTGNVAQSPSNITVTSFSGTYTEAGNENYTVVP